MNHCPHVPSVDHPGSPQTASQLLTHLYDELRLLAAQRLAHEPAGQTLQPTALLHEAYLRLVDTSTAQRWDGHGHFFAAAAEAMRRILVDRARHKRSLKAGGGRRRLERIEPEPAATGPEIDLLALNEALDNLEAHDKRTADLVKLRFFADFTVAQAAEALGISLSTAANDWAYARSWLRLALGWDGIDEQ